MPFLGAVIGLRCAIYSPRLKTSGNQRVSRYAIFSQSKNLLLELNMNPHPRERPSTIVSPPDCPLIRHFYVQTIFGLFPLHRSNLLAWQVGSVQVCITPLVPPSPPIRSGPSTSGFAHSLCSCLPHNGEELFLIFCPPLTTALLLNIYGAMVSWSGWLPCPLRILQAYDKGLVLAVL